MIKATFEYNPELVCYQCGTNEYVYYKLVLEHGESVVTSDVMCSYCDCSTALTSKEDVNDEGDH